MTAVVGCFLPPTRRRQEEGALHVEDKTMLLAHAVETALTSAGAEAKQGKTDELTKLLARVCTSFASVFPGGEGDSVGRELQVLLSALENTCATQLVEAGGDIAALVENQEEAIKSLRGWAADDAYFGPLKGTRG